MKKFMERGEALGHQYPDKERILAELKPGKKDMNLDLKTLSHKHHKTPSSMAQKLSARRQVSPFEPAACKSFMSSANGQSHQSQHNNDESTSSLTEDSITES